MRQHFEKLGFSMDRMKYIFFETEMILWSCLFHSQNTQIRKPSGELESGISLIICCRLFLSIPKRQMVCKS